MTSRNDDPIDVIPISTDEQTTNSSNNLDHTNSPSGTSELDRKSKKVKVEWSPENEWILVEWCDVAQCYKWLNSRSYAKYSKLHAWFTIPAIILSTLSGTASFAQASIPDSFKELAPIAIGSLNIFIGILTTIQQYLKISELNEAHRISAISWDKFARNIRIELAKHPDERSDAGSFLKLSRGEFDRLMETSPDIGETIINEFNNRFSGKPGTDRRRRFDQLRKPDICDIMVSANETRHKWYLALDNANDHMHDYDASGEEVKAKNSIIQAQQQQLEAVASEIKRREENEQLALQRQLELIKTNQQKQAEAEAFVNEQTNSIKKYISSFENIYDRKPLTDEIKDNMAGQVEMAVLEKFLDRYAPM